MKDCFRETLARIRVYEVLFSKICNTGYLVKTYYPGVTRGCNDASRCSMMQAGLEDVDDVGL